MRKTRLKLYTESTVFHSGKERAVVIEWAPGQPDLLTLRLKGTRGGGHTITPAAVYLIAEDREGAKAVAAKETRWPRR